MEYLFWNILAYLDPGSGSFIVQMLVAALVAVLFTVKSTFLRIKMFFLGLFTSKKENQDSEE